MQSTHELSILQQAADQVVVRRDLKVNGIIVTIFGALALFGAVVPPADPLLLALGCLLAVAGLWNLTNPHPRGIAFIGVCLIAVGAYNIGSGFVEAAAGGRPSVFWQVLGVWQIIWGCQSYPRYRRFARSFEGDPETTYLEQAKQAIRDLQRARPKKSPDVIEFIVLGFSPRAARARLAPGHVLCLVGNGDDVLVCPSERFDVQVTGRARLSKSSTAVIHVDGRSFKAQISDEHLERFRAWKAGATPALAAAA